MKTKFITLLALTALFCSCSKSDDAATSYDGTYKLTAFNVAVAQDLNGDGVKSNNLMLESNCFNDNFLILKNDNSYSLTSKGLDLEVSNTAPPIKVCFDDGIEINTWTNNGATITLKNSFEDMQLTANNNTLKYSKQGSYVSATILGGLVTYGYTLGNIECIYTKQ